MSQSLPIRNFRVAGLALAALAVVVHFLSGENWALFLRDCLGHLAFAHLFASWLLSLPSVERNSQPFVDLGTPSLIALAKLLPGATFLQIVLGAAYRHSLAPFWPHLTGAILVSGLLVYAATGVLTPAPAGQRCRTAALGLLWVTLAQVGFGIAAYFTKMSVDPSPALRGNTHAHIATGALTFGFVLALAVLLRRDVRTSPVLEEELPGLNASA